MWWIGIGLSMANHNCYKTTITMIEVIYSTRALWDIIDYHGFTVIRSKIFSTGQNTRAHLLLTILADVSAGFTDKRFHSRVKHTN